MPEPPTRSASAVFAELAVAMLSIAAAFLVIGSVASSDAVWRLLPAPRGSPVVTFLMTPVMWLIAALVYRAVGRWMDGERPAAPLCAHDQRPTLIAALLSALLHIALAVLGSAVLAQLLGLLGFPVTEQSSVLDIVSRGGAELALLMGTALLLAPLTEELLFRGQLFRRLVSSGGRPAAYAISALAFALIHGNPAGFLVYVWLGYVFARAYVHTGRLWTAMLVHAGNNAATLAILLWLPGDAG